MNCKHELFKKNLKKQLKLANIIKETGQRSIDSKHLKINGAMRIHETKHEKVKSNELERIIPQQILYSCILNEQHGLETFIISTNTNERVIHVFICPVYRIPYTIYLYCPEYSVFGSKARFEIQWLKNQHSRD